MKDLTDGSQGFDKESYDKLTLNVCLQTSLNATNRHKYHFVQSCYPKNWYLMLACKLLLGASPKGVPHIHTSGYICVPVDTQTCQSSHMWCAHMLIVSVFVGSRVGGEVDVNWTRRKPRMHFCRAWKEQKKTGFSQLHLVRKL